tara:strand:- start:2153 stop:3115 length:963 start_codon:yes stop_codon:yes gene_type:complete
MILITGAAGFIGYHVCDKLLSKNIKIVAIDNLNNYYDINLKKARINDLRKKYKKKFIFLKLDIRNYNKLFKIFKKYKFKIIIHLAAQAGVRYSIFNPKVYLDSNINGFFNLLEIAKNFKIKHFMFSSSSSVYGDKIKFPIKESEDTSKPLSFYAATKKSDEVLSYSYSNIYKIPITCLRLFTVYGPFGRPDMAPFKFTKAAYENKTISVHNYGIHQRDFTYVSDISDSIFKLLNKTSKKKLFEIINICSSKTIKLKNFIKIIEKYTEKRIKKKFIKKQKGDVIKTFGDNKKLKKITKINKFVPVEEGMKKFIDWYVKYHF